MTIRSTFLLASISIVALGACTAKKSVQDTVRFRLPSEPPSLDWSLATDNISREVITHIQEGLVEHDVESKVQPAMAESWIVSADGKTYTFKLRENIKWSDGQALTAQHFVDAWQRLLEPAVASEYAYFLFDIEGAEDYFTKKSNDFAKVNVKALDDRTLQVKLRAPAAYWLHIPTFWVTYPIRMDVVKAKGDRWTEPANIVSAGPYLLKVHEHDNRIVLEKNPNYYRSAPGMIGTVEFRVVRENATAVSLFNNHDLDIVRDLPPIQVKSLSKRPEFKTSPFLRGYYIGFNVKDADVSDVKIRQAIGHAINRQELEQVVGPQIRGTTSWVPNGMLAYNADVGLKFDPELAKKLWASAAKRPKKVELWFDQKELNKLVAENVQNQIKRVLGVEVTLSTLEWKVYLKTLHTKTPSMWRMGWGADYPDPDNFMNLFTCESGNNYSKMCDKHYDALIKSSGSISDETKRIAAYNELQTILLEKQVAIVPLFQETNMHLVAPRVANFKVNSMGEFQFKNLRLQ